MAKQLNQTSALNPCALGAPHCACLTLNPLRPLRAPSLQSQKTRRRRRRNCDSRRRSASQCSAETISWLAECCLDRLAAPALHRGAARIAAAAAAAVAAAAAAAFAVVIAAAAAAAVAVAVAAAAAAVIAGMPGCSCPLRAANAKRAGPLQRLCVSCAAASHPVFARAPEERLKLGSQVFWL